MSLVTGKVSVGGTQTEVKLSPSDEVVVRLSLSDNLELTSGELSRKVAVPKADQPRVLSYEVKGLSAGPAQIIVRLFQPTRSGEQVGYLPVGVEVVASPATPALRLKPVAQAYPPSGCAPPDCTLFIEEEPSPKGVRVKFRITTATPPYPSQFNYDGHAMGSTQDLQIDPSLYFQERFKNIEVRPLASPSDVQFLQVTMRSQGDQLYQDLLSAELRQELEVRGHLISSVQIKSDRANHIPWEMIRLPAFSKDGKSSPAEFMAERYQVTRWIERWGPPATIDLGRLCYIAPHYQSGQALVYASEEVKFLESLKAAGVTPERVIALPVPIIDVLDSTPFNVLHYVGHASQATGTVAFSTLELETESRNMGGVQTLVPNALEPIHVSNKQATWGARRPLVFFNACQTGRSDVGLVRPGGWADALLASKAGAFIGTLWSVRDNAACLFAQTFYESLLGGQTLGQSALTARRKVAHQLHDPSWLAYVAYGHPNTKGTVGG